jgi:DNA-binding transcriptional MerR regulator
VAEITVKELAERIRRPDEPLHAVIRRVRDWTRQGLLNPAGKRNPGTGHHRRYDEPAAMNALALSALTRLGIDAGRSGKLKTREEAFFQLARMGLSQAAEAPDRIIYLVSSADPKKDNSIYLYRGDDVTSIDDEGKVQLRRSRLHVKYPHEELEACIVINLTALLERAKKAEKVANG